MTKESLATPVEYCPQCEPRPEKPENQNPLNLKVSVPKICDFHRDANSQLKAEAIASGKVKVRKILPGVSARPKEEHQKSLLNLTGRHASKGNRPKPQPP